MATLYQNFDGAGANGQTLSAANTNGAGNTALDTLVLGATAAAILDTTRSTDGTQSAKFTSGATSSTSYYTWGTGWGSQTTTFMWADCFIPTGGTGTIRILTANDSGGTLCGNIKTTSSMGFLLTDAGGVTVFTAPSSTLPLDAWFRIEFAMTHGSPTTGAMQAKIYRTLASATPNYDTGPVTSINVGLQSSTFRIGLGQSLVGGILWMDKVGAQNTLAWGKNSTTATPVTLTQDFDGGTGAANGITLSTANTNGAGDTPAASLTITGGTATAQFDSSLHTDGALSAKFTTGTSSGTSYFSWVGAWGTQTTTFMWGDVYRSSLGAGQSRFFAAQVAAGTPAANIRFGTTGAITILDAAGATVVTSATNVIPVDAWCRVEFAITHDTVNGTVQAKVYTTLTSATPSYDSGLFPTVNTGAASTELRFGSSAGGIGIIVSLDRVGAQNSISWGKVGAGSSNTLVATTTPFGSSSLTVSGSVIPVGAATLSATAPLSSSAVLRTTATLVPIVVVTPGGGVIAAAHAYTSLPKSMSDGLIDIDTDPLKVMLLSAYTVGSTQDTAQFVSNVLAVATQSSGSGYTAGGATLTTVTLVKSGHLYTLDCNDVTWTNAAFSAAYCLFYAARAGSVAANQPVICYWDLGTTWSPSLAPFTLTMPAAGLVTFTGA